MYTLFLVILSNHNVYSQGIFCVNGRLWDQPMVSENSDVRLLTSIWVPKASSESQVHYLPFGSGLQSLYLRLRYRYLRFRAGIWDSDGTFSFELLRSKYRFWDSDPCFLNSIWDWKEASELQVQYANYGSDIESIDLRPQIPPQIPVSEIQDVHLRLRCIVSIMALRLRECIWDSDTSLQIGIWDSKEASES